MNSTFLCGLIGLNYVLFASEQLKRNKMASHITLVTKSLFKCFSPLVIQLSCEQALRTKKNEEKARRKERRACPHFLEI